MWKSETYLLCQICGHIIIKGSFRALILLIIQIDNIIIFFKKWPGTASLTPKLAVPSVKIRQVFTGSNIGYTIIKGLFRALFLTIGLPTFDQVNTCLIFTGGTATRKKYVQ